MNKRWDTLWINATILTCEDGADLLEQAAIACKDGKIAWVGTMQSLLGEPETLAKSVYNVKGDCITPGLIDCHTHIIYAGNRAYEFELRLEGATYEEIASQGGGIQATVAKTRGASEEELFQQSLKRARALMASGVTTIEIKSGYGLDLDSELKMLSVAKRIEETLPITVRKTFLGAHTLPAEYKGKADEYIDVVCNKILPIIVEEKLADAVDVFCEKIAFNLEQTERVFKAAQKYGLAVKCHAEQLSNSGSAALAVAYRALSVDHLEYADEEGIKAIAESGTVAVLLPGAFYFLRETKLPPIDLLREYKVPIAIASDCNPGTSPIMSLLLILNMGCTLYRLTTEEVLHGVTRNAARALGMADTHGTLTVGKSADLAVWDAAYPAELAYYLGGNPLKQLVKMGRIVADESM